MKITKENLKQIIKEEIEAVLNEEEIQYVFPTPDERTDITRRRREMCDDMKSLQNLPVQWVIRDDRGNVVQPGQGGKGRCELLPNATRASLPRHLRENLKEE